MIFKLRVFLALMLGLSAGSVAMEKIIEKANPSLPLQILLKIGFEIDDDKTRINFFSASKKLREKGKNYYTERGEKVWKELFPDIAPSTNWTVLCMLYKYQDFIKLLRQNTEIEFSDYTKSRRVKKRKGDSTTSVFWDELLKKLPDSLDFTCRLSPKDTFKIMENVPLKYFLLDMMPLEVCVRSWFTLSSVAAYVSRKEIEEKKIIDLLIAIKLFSFYKKNSYSFHKRCEMLEINLIKYHKNILRNNKDSFFAIFYNKAHKTRKKLFKSKPFYHLKATYCIWLKEDISK